jgi:hypothetical protein
MGEAAQPANYRNPREQSGHLLQRRHIPSLKHTSSHWSRYPGFEMLSHRHDPSSVESRFNPAALARGQQDDVIRGSVRPQGDGHLATVGRVFKAAAVAVTWSQPTLDRVAAGRKPLSKHRPIGKRYSAGRAPTGVRRNSEVGLESLDVGALRAKVRLVHHQTVRPTRKWVFSGHEPGDSRSTPNCDERDDQPAESMSSHAPWTLTVCCLFHTRSWRHLTGSTGRLRGWAPCRAGRVASDLPQGSPQGSEPDSVPDRGSAQHRCAS